MDLPGLSRVAMSLLVPALFVAVHLYDPTSRLMLESWIMSVPLLSTIQNTVASFTSANEIVRIFA